MDMRPLLVIKFQVTGKFRMGNARGFPCNPIRVSGNTAPPRAAAPTGEK